MDSARESGLALVPAEQRHGLALDPAAAGVIMSVAVAAPGNGDALPRRFGPYILFDKIGEGGMARIFLAREKTALGAIGSSSSRRSCRFSPRART